MTAPQQPGWYPDRGDPPGIAVVTPQPKDDPFYSYTDPLDGIAPGTVLKTRSFHYHIFGFPTLLETTQLLYRSTSQTGKPTVNVTSIIKPPIHVDETKVISYQSAYDSLNRNDEPSYAISGGLRL
ncbi:MAG: triacylglycerol lipase, partial [Mycobacterium sp.]